jgi:hypothetical protein
MKYVISLYPPILSLNVIIRYYDKTRCGHKLYKYGHERPGSAAGVQSM